MDTRAQDNYDDISNHQNTIPPLHYFTFMNFSFSPPLTQYKGYQRQNQSQPIRKSQVIQPNQIKSPSQLNNKELQEKLKRHKDQTQVLKQKQKEKQYQKENQREKQRLKAEYTQRHMQEQKQRFYTFAQIDRKENVENKYQVSKEQALQQKRQLQSYNLMMFLGKKLQQRRQFQQFNMRILHELLNEQQYRNLPQLQQQKVSKAYQAKLSQRERDFVRKQLAQIQSYKQETKKRIQFTLRQSRQELQKQKVILEINKNKLDQLDKRIKQEQIFTKSSYQNQPLSSTTSTALSQPTKSSEPVNVDTKTQIVEIKIQQSPKIVVNVNNQPPPPDTMRGQIHAVGNWLLSFREDWRGLKSDIKNSQIYIQCRNRIQQFSIQYQQPIIKLYRNLPSIITQAKYQLISEYSYKQRIIFLTSLSIISGLSSLYWWRRHLGIGTLRMTRSLVLGFVVGGIFITPQIYYPFMKQSSLSSLGNTQSNEKVDKKQ